MGQLDNTPAWLARLLDEHARALVLYARGRCDCPEDVVPEALLRLVSQRKRPQRLVPWLYRVVRNGAISAARKQRRRGKRERRVAAPVAWFEEGDSALDAQQASAALAALPLELGEVVIARIWGDLTFAEIAELTGTSTSTAQRRYEQGIRELQSRLEQPCTIRNRRTTS